MDEPKKTKDLKDLKSWDEDLANLKPSSRDSSRPMKSAMRAPTRDDTRVSEQLESEWEDKIREAKRTDKELIKPIEKPTEKFESIDQVFQKLRKDESVKPVVKAKPGGKRLDKIGGTILGEVPEVKERDLTGQQISGIYALNPLGRFPPLNFLSKVMYSISSKSLESDLQNSNIPLYPDEYANFSVAIGFIVALLVSVLTLVIIQFNLSLLIFVIIAFILTISVVSLIVVNLPSIQVKSGSSDVDKQLPFALRHLSALLTAGISIFDSIVSVSKTDYGHLAKELDKVVWDVKSGENLSDALDEASHRIGSRSFMRVTVHIRRALQMGGDIAKIISQIADDLTFEMRMKVSDFVEKLNAFAIVYIIGGIVGPVVIAVFSVVGSAGSFQQQGIAASMDQFSLLFLMVIVFPMLMVLIAYIVHVMEPKV